MKQLIIAATALAMLSGCATMNSPTQAQVQSFDYGPQPDTAKAIVEAKQVMSGFLKDPYSAKWDCAPTTVKSWVHMPFTKTEDTFYGWQLRCVINAKNSYGGYTGGRHYDFWFRNDQVVRAVDFIGNEPTLSNMEVLY